MRALIAALCAAALLSSSAAMAQQVPHPTNGPAASTIDGLAIWAAANGGSLKNALGTVVQHTGGLHANDTGTPPISFPFYDFTNKTFNLFESSSTAPHIGEYHSTVVIKNDSVGSGQNGPGHDDIALTLACNRTNYLTTTAQGEMGCLWSYIQMGAKGDTSGLLSGIKRVDDPTVPNYGSTALETDVEHVTSSGASIRRAHYSTGYATTGFQEITGVVAGAGGTCRLTVANTVPFDAVTGSVGMTVTGVRGSTECNGQWGTIIKVDATHVELVNSKFAHTYTGGGAAGTPLFSLGGPDFGFEARAQGGQHGIGFLVDRAVLPNAGSWGSAFKVRLENEFAVAFDMSGNSGKFIVQPPTLPSLLDEFYSASFLAGPIRIAGTTASMPAQPDRFPWNTYPGGGVIGYNYSGGSAEIDIWNLFPDAAATLVLYQKTGVATQKAMFVVSDSGSSIASGLRIAGGTTTNGLVVGATAFAMGEGTINVQDKFYSQDTPGVSCTGTPTSAFQSIGGIVVHC